jgi:anti-sigma factor RsiW
MADCVDPVPPADIVDYWAGELEPHDAERLEQHLFTCAACAAAIAEGEALTRGVRQLVRSGSFHALITDTVLNRLARDGVRIRAYSLAPGDIVPCAVWADDEVVVTRLRGDFAGVDTVSVMATLATGEVLSQADGIAVPAGQHELLDAISAEWLRRLPATTIRLRVTTSRDGNDRLLGEYVLEHAGSLAHD